MVSYLNVKKLFFIQLILLTVAFSCKRDNGDEPQVPRIATDLTININLPQYNSLSNPGGWAYVTGGSRGIIVYRIGLDEFSAFDRHCPYNVTQGCQVSVLDGIIAEDTVCCHSQFEILYGTPVTGPAEHTLQSFRTQFNPNANLLRIYN